MPKEHERRIWDCIVAYNGDSARQIQTMYNNDMNRILARLSTFPNKTSYAGHRSGGSGDGENESARRIREGAINHLRNAAPPERQRSNKKPGANKTLKARSVNATHRLTSIIASNNDLGKIERLLFEEDPHWYNNKNIINEYNLKRRAKGKPEKKKKHFSS